MKNELCLDDEELLKMITNFIIKKHGKEKFIRPYGTQILISKNGLYIKDLGLLPEDMRDMYLEEEK